MELERPTTSPPPPQPPGQPRAEPPPQPPGKTPAASFNTALAAARTTPYTVRPGDTLTGIAAAHQLHLNALAAANPAITNSNLIHPGQTLAIPEPAPPRPQVSPARTQPPKQPLAGPGIAAQAQSIIAAAQHQSTPAAALKTLSAGTARAPAAVQQAVRADPETAHITAAAAQWANAPLTRTTGAIMPGGQVTQALARLDSLAQGTDPNLAAATAAGAMPGYDKFFQANDTANLIGSQGMASLMDLSGRIAGTPQGDSAINGFAQHGAWDRFGMMNAIGAGGNLAYPLALARTLKASGQDPSGVTQYITDGMQLFQQKIGSDVHDLASHDAELAWVMKNQGANMTPSQIAAGIAAYAASKGPGWQEQQAQLQSRIGRDGAQLLAQMQALAGTRGAPGGNDAGFSTSGTEATLKAIVNDPSANLAISTAINTDPGLVSDDQATSLHTLFTGAELGEAGKSLTEQLATSYVRQNLLAKLQGLHLQGTDSMLNVQNAKADIESLAHGPMARLLGVSQDQMDGAVDALKGAVLGMSHNIGDPQAEQTQLAALNRKFDTDPEFSEAFNGNTFAGQLMRGVGVAFAGVGLYDAAGQAASDPSVQNDASALLAAAGFAQKSADALTSIGAISEASTLGKFGGALKLLGDADAGDMIDGIGAVLGGISAVRSGFGLGEERNIPEAVFSGLGAVGGGMMAAGAVGEFAGASMFGPIGAGLAAVGIVGDAIYTYFKGQHQYEDAGNAFLGGAGYNPAAAHALSRQVDDGKAMMPFLDKYASLIGLPPARQTAWVNSLSNSQLQSLAQDLQSVVSDTGGSTKDFTNGPAQATAPEITRFLYEPSRLLDNTLGVFQSRLNQSNMPRPVAGP